MGCSCIPNHDFNFCPEPHEVIVNNDIKRCSEKLGFDFEAFRDFMWKNKNYAVAGFGFLVVHKDGNQFDSYIYAGERAFIINSKIGKAWPARYSEIKISVDAAYAEREKEEMRQKLRSVGIEPTW